MPKSHIDQILVRIENFPHFSYFALAKITHVLLFYCLRGVKKITNLSSLFPLKTLNSDHSSSMDQPRFCGPKRKADNVDTPTCKHGFQEHLDGKKQKSRESILRAENNESEEDKGNELMMKEQGTESEVPETEIEAKEEEEEEEEFYCEICDIWCNSGIMMNIHLRGKKHKAKELKKHEIGCDPREKRELWCEVCKLRCNSEVVMENHLKGKKHKVKEGAFRLEYAKEEEGGERKVVEETGNEKTLIALMKGNANARNGLWCEICDVRCNSKVAMEMHLKGKKHKAKEGFVRIGHEKEEEVCNEKKDHDDGNDPQENISHEKALMVTEGNRNAKNELLCDIHEAKCYGEVVMENHLKGEKLKQNEGSRVDNEKEQEEKEERIIEEISNEKATMVKESIEKNRLWCEICNVRCNSEVVMAAHCRGKKHRTKEAKIACRKTKGQEEEMKEEEKIDTEIHNAKNDEEESGNCRAMVEANKNMNNVHLHEKQPKELWCLICKVKCDSRAMMMAHLKCLEHKEKEAQRWGKPIIGATEDKEGEKE